MSCGKKWKYKKKKVYGIPHVSKNLTWIEIRHLFWSYVYKHHYSEEMKDEIWNKYFKELNDTALGWNTYFSDRRACDLEYYKKRYGKRIKEIKLIGETGISIFIDENM
jgi:hypothetical protein